MQHHQTDIGELIASFFQQFMDVYEDEQIAAVATAAAINDLLSQRAVPPHGQEAA